MTRSSRWAWAGLLGAGMLLSLWQGLVLHEGPGRHDGHDHGHSAAAPERLYAWHADQVAGITLATRDVTLRMRSDRAAWRELPVPDFDAAAFVATFSQLRSERRFAPQPGESYGLQPPHLRITLHDDDGGTLADLEVGDPVPDGFGRYARVPGEADVRVVPDYQTRAPMQAMRARRPSPHF